MASTPLLDSTAAWQRPATHRLSLTAARGPRHPVGPMRPVALAALAALSVVTPWAAPSAWAQDAPPTLPAVTVQAVRDAGAVPLDVAGLGDAPLARTPLSANVIGSAQMQAVGAQRLADLLVFDASTHDAYNAIGYYDAVSVRGYTLNNRSNFRRDGLPITADTEIALDNKAAVEILKGASGLQAGTSVPGGLVNYVVKRPGAVDTRQLRMDVNQWDEASAAIDLIGRFGADKDGGWRLNAAAGALKSAAPGTSGQRQLVALAVEQRLNRDSLIEAEVEVSHRSQPSVPGLSLLGNRLPSPDPKLNLGVQPWTLPVVTDGVTASLRFTQQLAKGWRWTTQLGTQQLRTDDRSAFPFGCSTDGVYDRYCANGDVDLYDFRSENEHRRLHALRSELQGQVDTGRVRHQIAASVLFSERSEHYQGQAYNWLGTSNVFKPVAFAPDPTLYSWNTNREERTQELALSDVIRWGERWTTWAGLRHTQLTRRSAATDGSNPLSDTRSLDTPWVAASYQWTSSSMLYVSRSEGVEAEVAPNQPMYANAGRGLPALKSRQWEAGLKNERGPRSWSVAWFDITRPAFADSGACDGSVGSCSRRIDGAAHHRGLETSFNRRTTNWTYGAGAMWLNARREGSTTLPAANGLRPVNVPEFTARAHANYRLASAPAWSVSANVSHEGRRAVLPDNGLMLPAWTRVDASLIWQPPGTTQRWSLGLDNVGNRQFFREAPLSYGHVYLFPAQPQTVRINFQTNL